MSRSSDIFVEVMESIWIADPISQRGEKVKFNNGFTAGKDDYLKRVFVEPFTIYNRSKGIESDKDDYDYEEELSYQKIVDINDIVKKKEDFERSLKNVEEYLYIVQGGPGCGKSTYVHHLAVMDDYKNINFDFCNFEIVKSGIFMFKKPYDFEAFYENNVWKFISLIAKKISDIIVSYDSTEIASSRMDFIHKLSTTYQKCFYNYETEILDDKDVRDFFKTMNCAMNVNCSEEYLYDELYNYFSVVFKEYIIQINAEQDENKKSKIRLSIVRHICGILIRLYFCLNRIYAEIGEDKKYVLVIDNVESFVIQDSEHPIQDCELNTIFKGIKIAASTAYDNISLMRATDWDYFSDYQSSYAFLVATRHSSLSLMMVDQEDDFDLERFIDITSWFFLEDISEKKMKFFYLSEDRIKNNPYYIAFKTIISDTSWTYWGMNNVISRMYNYNLRRIGSDLINALSLQPESAIINFNEQWKRQKHNDDSVTRHMCRKYVLRVLLDYIEHTQYLKRLMVEHTNYHNRLADNRILSKQNSYARKIATILSRASEESAVPKFVPLVILIKYVLLPPYSKGDVIEDEQLEDFSKILFLMAETRKRDTRWVPLVYIKFDMCKTYNEEKLKEIVERQWREYSLSGRISSEMGNYGVRISEAGKFFAKIVPEFEYFACRYTHDSPALMVSENLKKSLNGRSYKCLDIIRTVRENAYQCVVELLESESRFFEDSDTGEIDWSMLEGEHAEYKWWYCVENGDRKRYIDHPTRILNAHKGYLHHYKEFVYALPETEINAIAKSEILNGIQNEIDAYDENIQKIIVEYGLIK